MSGLFGTLNIGKSGMFAQQGAINVTSHNISNANTEGYTRQRAELQTTRPYCKPSMQNYAGPGQVGTGVEIAAINRVRDSFLDYQTRVELGVQGQYSSRNKFLSQIENILREPTDTAISGLIGEFFDAWGSFSDQAETSNARSVVIEQSKSLVNQLNHTFNELEQLKSNTQTQISEDVFTMNSILNQINQVNQQIIQVKVAGQQPNDLMDRRDLLLDKLSEKFGIETSREEFQGLDLTASNRAKNFQGSTSALGGEPPKVKVLDDKGKVILDKNNKEITKSLNLVQTLNPDDVGRFAYISDIKPAPADEQEKNKPISKGDAGVYKVTYYKNGDTTSDDNKVTINVKISDTKDFERLDQCRVLWTKDGDAITVDNNIKNGQIGEGEGCEFSQLKLFEPPSGALRGYMSVQKDIDEYENKLNNLAKGLAFSVNAIHTQSKDFEADTSTVMNFFVNGEDSTEDGEGKITAQNITINKKILENPMKIIAGSDPSTDKVGESDNARAMAISALRNTLMAIQKINRGSTRADFLKENEFAQKDGSIIKTFSKNTSGMTLDGYFNDIVGNLGIATQEANRMTTGQASVLASYQQQRDSVSGVSLDEEFANLVQFTHCYQANGKVISTVDELLDVVINGLMR
ncbi:flagellar hook-associated protein FlgK [Clostridium oceanicum]|uniref:Flagellar hook-associated protein 1 n=1 Tax=Clostridium oceanicum TaxID=1543 RepID=A0ABP3V2W6_9CLOT